MARTGRGTISETRAVGPGLWLSLVVTLAAASGAACSSSAASGTGGTSGGSGGAGGSASGDAPYKPCSLETRVGRFALALEHEVVPPAAPNPAYSQLIGGVRDSVNPIDIWVMSGASSGGCRLMVGPTSSCTPACPSGMVCKAGACLAAPVSHTVGPLMVTGFEMPTTITPNGANTYYWSSSGISYPPYTPGTSVGIKAAGGDYPPGFSLTARGIEPLEVPEGQALPISTTKANSALSVSWQAPSQPSGAGRMFLSLDIAHHGGVLAELQCDVPDSGSATIPGSLLDALVAAGTFGFPEITMTRLSVDSTTIAPGCVEFAVGASLRRPLMVEGVTSCNDSDDCPAGQACVSLKCT